MEQSKISVVINTLNEEKNIARAIKSVKWADEIIVCDMHSDDKTVQIAKKSRAKVFYHQRVGYVEPARNFAISKTSNDWILLLDADEEIPATLAEKIKDIGSKNEVDVVWIPRKNIIFGKWMVASLWWPDFNVRFFRKSAVEWRNEIHSNPEISGRQTYLAEEEALAIVHYHYQSVAQFICRLNRYTDIQSQEIIKTDYKFNWLDLISKPTNEFLSRFFAGRGFEDGLHGFGLSLLQALSYVVLYLKVWEKQGFNQEMIDLKVLGTEIKEVDRDISYWFNLTNSNNKFKRLLQKISNKLP